MIVVVLAAGISLVLAGLLAIGYGIPIKEFGFGNTLILAGAMATCAGIVVLGLWTAVRELRNIAQRLDANIAAETQAGSMLPPTAETDALDAQTRDGGFLLGRDRPAAERAGSAEPATQSSPPPWHAEAAARDVPSAAEPVEAAPAFKPRRNLLFSSSLRREREGAQARMNEPSAADLATGPAAAPPASESSRMPSATFEDSWPKPERPRGADTPLPRRSEPTPSTFTKAPAGGADRSPPAARNEEQPPVTVLKSGVVDGMAYSLYSDGSIEAQLPEGMMRFASIDELRTHLDQRP